MEAGILFSVLIVTIMMSIPIGITLGLSTGIAMFLTSDIPMLMLVQKSVTGLDSFPLLAIPFFILAGSLMCNGGISRRLVNLADSLVGWVTGGLAMVTVLACMFFAAISGSGPATVSAIGSFMIPSMKDRGYDAPFAAAITAAAGTIGVIIPPSIPFVIYSIVAQCSIGDMFIAGILPGILIGLALMTVCYVTAKKKHYISIKDRPRFSTVIKAFIDAIWALITPIIILGGIYGGIFTPTEAAVVAVVYSVIIGKFVYKELNFEVLYECLRTSALINGATEFMIGLSMAFAAYLSMAQIPQAMGSWLGGLASSPWMLLLVINIFLLILGCFVDNIAAVIILTPILLPVVKMIGIDPIHFGIIMTVNLCCGFISPPYGINLFVASAISGVSIEKISIAIIPSFVAMVVCLMLLTYFPIISMFLPNMMR
ncbi:MAG: TRAP transporter large permease [Bacteroidia bacterium]|nr:TRAP transporter large permease [Bacteroidia bacterium]